ncbi:hypothetical protein D3C80_1342350 [compost metagenome]
MDLALRMMKTAGTRPTIGTAEYGLRAKIPVNALKFVCDQLHRLGPANFNVIIGATFSCVGRCLLKPATPDGGASDTSRTIGNRRNVAQQGRRVRIVGMRPDV